MMLRPTEIMWTSDEARQQFEALQKMRDEVAASFSICPTLLQTPERLSREMTATEVTANELRMLRDRTLERASSLEVAELERAYRNALEPYTRQMVKLAARFTTQQAILLADDNR